MTGFLDRLAEWLSGPIESSPTVTGAPPSPAPPAGPVISADDPRLPETSRPLVARLLALIAEIEARTRDDTLMISAATEVRQMRDDHLPRLIESYAEIPPSHRAEIFRQTGRSASYNLNQGFERMIARLEALSRSLAQEDLDSFADNLRFIENRYGKGDDPLR
ncbi:hypothetical protein PX554_03660 [Sphingomonas sp. H39-1-10]|uniref:hypothetical protein n=1 Tax=Sphingomonas pollutisoli TaxID=3030829 RepID=UPI0023B9C662|nr:hypothetical protein [Sphingomonas pollutisoli]MDF0487215.1 hypothetical protein [Sphingomonas pollutisoli]